MFKEVKWLMKANKRQEGVVVVEAPFVANINKGTNLSIVRSLLHTYFRQTQQYHHVQTILCICDIVRNWVYFCYIVSFKPK